MMSNQEYVLYGLPEGETRNYMEEILLVTKSEQSINTAKKIASDTFGWHSLRIAIFNPRKP